MPTSEAMYKYLIVYALLEIKERPKRAMVLSWIRENTILQPDDFEWVPGQNQRRYENRASWTRKKLVNDDDILDGSARGLWAFAPHVHAEISSLRSMGKSNHEIAVALTGIVPDRPILRNRLSVQTTPSPVDYAESQCPERVLEEVFRVARNTTLSTNLKAHYGRCCQVCGLSVVLPRGQRYVEVHHLRPLGGKHAGQDILGNMIVLCPNHHIAFDYGAIAVEPRTFQVVGMGIEDSRLMLKPPHELDERYIVYHLDNIYNPE